MNLPPREYAFNERMAMSQGHSASKSIGSILLENIPGAVNVTQAHSSNDRTGTDWWVEHRASKHLSVDCKVREEDWAAKPAAADDLALETFSVVEKKIVGWTRDPAKKTDYVLWLWLDTGRWCLIPFPMLCAVFSEHWESWREKYKTKQQKTTRDDGSGYHSECTFVPRKVVWSAIYRRFAGSVAVAPTVSPPSPSPRPAPPVAAGQSRPLFDMDAPF